MDNGIKIKLEEDTTDPRYYILTIILNNKMSVFNVSKKITNKELVVYIDNILNRLYGK